LRPGYGLGASERVIEIPWLLSKRPSGRALDAGSSLNHPEFLDRLEPLVEQLHVITLAYEGVAYPERGISYTFDDLRDLPYRDGHFETVISISTLEHVGMDNTAYAGRTQGAAASNDPVEDTARAIRELVRVTRPGGRLLVTVPYGERQDLGWQRQFDLADIEFLLSTAAPSESEVTVYRYHSSGWALSGLEEAADAQYREAVGAEAVACISMSR
jgi:SAM-dependent methyltransferase